jgi:DNA ligase (NAD+)
LGRRFESLDAFVAGAMSAEAGSDAALRAAKVFFDDPANRSVVTELVALGIGRGDAPAKVATSSSLAGKVFVLTGTLATLTRAQAAAKIEAAGGKVAASVSRATHYVVAGSDAGAKLAQAKKLGVTVLDEAALLRMVEEK